MPVDFLTKEQKQRYGKFSEKLNEVQLARYFHLSKADLDFISERRGQQNKLGFALQISVTRFLGTFISNFTEIPINVQIFVAQQLLIDNINILTSYAQRKKTRWEHNILIRKYYNYHEFNRSTWSFRLTRLLYSRSWINNERPSSMFDFSVAWLIRRRVLLPGILMRQLIRTIKPHNLFLYF